MLNISRAKIEDAERLAKCAREAYSNEISKNYDSKVNNDYPSVECVIHDIKKYDYYKINLDEEIIGGIYLVSINSVTKRIEDFCIIPKHQNKGYGTKALIQLEKMQPNIKLWTLSTPKYSIGNQALYKKLGYQEIGDTKEDGVDLVEFEKHIFAHGERITLEHAKIVDKKLIYDMLISPDVYNLMFDDEHNSPTWEEFNEGESDSLFTGIPNDVGSYLLIKIEGTTIGSISYAKNNGRKKSVELDIWISSNKYMGKGYGSEAIKLVLENLHNSYEIKTFLIRPWVKNSSAIKSYKKCGFKEIQNFDPLDYYSIEENEDYGSGDYGKEETVNLIYSYNE